MTTETDRMLGSRPSPDRKGNGDKQGETCPKSPDEIFERAEALCLLAVEDPSYLEEYQEAHKAAKSLEHSGWRRRPKVTQADIVLEHMETTGSITAREAILDHDITSAALARRICDLEERGHAILRQRRKHPISGKQYTRYTLVRDLEGVAA